MNSQLKEKYLIEKEAFHESLSRFAQTLKQQISNDEEWTIKGFIDLFKNIYTISSDTKIISKILELHLFPHLLDFANSVDYSIELSTHQNWYPDMTFINNKKKEIKFAVDLKTTYIDEKRAGYCNGFTLGSHGEYFINRESCKNIQYPNKDYTAHYCLGIIYSRAILNQENELKRYKIDEIALIPSVINQFVFFVNEKWKIASDKRGSGNTANIGSVKKISDLISGNGTFSLAGEEVFDDYWINYGKIKIKSKEGKVKPLTSMEEYVKYRKLSKSIINK